MSGSPQGRREVALGFCAASSRDKPVPAATLVAVVVAVLAGVVVPRP